LSAAAGTVPVARSRRGSFNVGSATDINWKHGHLIQRSDGYGYAVSASPDNPLNRITPPA
jgi:hypothetical protein